MANRNYQFYLQADLQKYTGQWVAISNQKVVAHGKSVKTVLKKAKEKSKSKPLLTRVPGKETMIF